MKCESCSAPDGKFITRRLPDLREWSTSLNLAKSRPGDYTSPRKVVLNVAGLCQACAKKIA